MDLEEITPSQFDSLLEHAQRRRRSAGASSSAPVGAMPSARHADEKMVAGPLSWPCSGGSAAAVSGTTYMAARSATAPAPACVRPTCSSAENGAVITSATGVDTAQQQSSPGEMPGSGQAMPRKRTLPSSFADVKRQRAAAQTDAAQQPAPSTAAVPPANPGRRRLPASLLVPSDRLEGGLLPPLLLPQGSMLYASTYEEVEQVCTFLLQSAVPFLGFDMEWRVTYRTGETPRPVALLQLAAQLPGRPPRCFLLHVVASGITPALRAVLCSPGIAKAGVGCSGDAQKLMRDFGLACAGMVDLSGEANARLCGPGSARLPEMWSLSRLAAAVLRVSLDKDPALRTSNWEAWPLSSAQQSYAALDALASLLLHQRLMAMPLPEPGPRLLSPTEQGDEPDAGPPLHVAATPEQAPLQPAKLAVWRLFQEQGMSVGDIADLRHIARDSAEGYLSEAIAAGFAYDWHRLSVPRRTLLAVAGQAAAACASSAAAAAAAGGAAHADGGGAGGPAELARRQGAVGGARSCAAVGDAGGGGEPAGGTGTDAVAWGRQAAWGGEEGALTQKLQAAGVSVRAIKERLPEGVRYGQIRLSLAHIDRCALLLQLLAEALLAEGKGCT